MSINKTVLSALSHRQYRSFGLRQIYGAYWICKTSAQETRKLINMLTYACFQWERTSDVWREISGVWTQIDPLARIPYPPVGCTVFRAHNMCDRFFSKSFLPKLINRMTSFRMPRFSHLYENLFYCTTLYLLATSSHLKRPNLRIETMTVTWLGCRK